MEVVAIITLLLILGGISLIMGVFFMNRLTVYSTIVFILCSLISIICLGTAIYMGYKKTEQKIWENPAPPIVMNEVQE